MNIQQIEASPPVQRGGKLPAEVHCVLETTIDAISAVRRMTVRRVTGDEDSALAVGVRHRKTQVPEADMLEFDIEFRPDSSMEQLPKIEVVLRRTARHRRMEKPARAQINPAEELPIPVQVGMKHVIERLARISLEQFVQPLRSEHQQDHETVVI